MQVKPANSLEDALEIMDKASSVNSMDAAGITSFVQSSDDDDDDDDSDSGAPDAAVYGNHSGGIIDTLNDLLEDMLTVESEQLDRICGCGMLYYGYGMDADRCCDH